MDFNQLAEDAPDVDPADPIALYESLDRKQTHVELRPAQRTVLELWRGRRCERDIVLKLPTGTGKTTVGLVMLASHMRESGRPVMYLCPTNQLAAQVVSEGERCGVACCLFGEGHRYIPPEVQAAEKVLVTSVQKLFNGRSVFARPDVAFEPKAILIDDAHAALDIVRMQFTIAVKSKVPLYTKLAGLFGPALREQSPGLVASLTNGDPTATIEVPYWHWGLRLDDVGRVLAAAAEDQKSLIGFVWGLVRDHLPAMRCVFSGASVEVTPEILPVSTVRAYQRAEHRIFMSATLSDEAALVRELDCAPSAALAPIEPSGVAGPGERMVIVPGLMATGAQALTRDGLMGICREVAQKHSVVVIAPSDEKAKEWGSVGARVVTHGVDDVVKAVDDLRAGKSRFVVFSNRYDGIDLPDDACRLLVLDGAPVAYSLLEAVDGGRGGHANVRQRTVVQRIEQGLGRAVRTPVDYAAVILWGDSLVSLVSDRAARAGMSEETRLQIELGLTIAKKAKGQGNPTLTVTELINQCLDRDTGWKKYYGQQVKAQLRPVDADARARRVEYASLEREAWQDFISNRGNEAGNRIQRHLNANRTLPDEERAWLLQRAAWYAGKFDAQQSLVWQRVAHECDPRMLRPPKGVQYQKQTAKLQTQGAGTLTWYRRFEHGLGAVADFNRVRAQLVFSPDASSELFEEGLHQLGTVIGFASSRPERHWGIGPDVLWLHGQTVMPVEAKSNVVLDSEFISKGDAGQLTQSTTWAQRTYVEREKLVPIIVHRAARAGDNAFPPDGTRVLTPALLNALLAAAEGTVLKLASKPGDQWSPDDVEQVLGTHNLLLPSFLSKYTTPGITR